MVTLLALLRDTIMDRSIELRQCNLRLFRHVHSVQCASGRPCDQLAICTVSCHDLWWYVMISCHAFVAMTLQARYARRVSLSLPPSLSWSRVWRLALAASHCIWIAEYVARNLAKKFQGEKHSTVLGGCMSSDQTCIVSDLTSCVLLGRRVFGPKQGRIQNKI